MNEEVLSEPPAEEGNDQEVAVEVPSREEVSEESMEDAPADDPNAPEDPEVPEESGA